MNYSNKTLLFLISYMFMPLMAISALEKTPPSIALTTSSRDLSQLPELPENLKAAFDTLNKFYVLIYSKKNTNPDIDLVLKKFEQLPDLLFITHLKYQELGKQIPDLVINTFLGQNPDLPKSQSFLLRLFTVGTSSILHMLTQKRPADNSISVINRFAVTALNNIRALGGTDDQSIDGQNTLSKDETAFFKSLLKKYLNGGPTIPFKALELTREYLKIDSTGGTKESRRKYYRKVLLKAEREEFEQTRKEFEQTRKDLENSFNSEIKEPTPYMIEIEKVPLLSETERKQLENHEALLLLEKEKESKRKEKIKETKIEIMRYAQTHFTEIHQYLLGQKKETQSLLKEKLKSSGKK